MLVKSKNKIIKECVLCTSVYYGRIDSQTCCPNCRHKLFELGFKGSTCKTLVVVLGAKEFDRFLNENSDNLNRYTWFHDKNNMAHIYLWDERFIELRDRLKLK